MRSTSLPIQRAGRTEKEQNFFSDSYQPYPHRINLRGNRKPISTGKQSQGLEAASKSLGDSIPDSFAGTGRLAGENPNHQPANCCKFQKSVGLSGHRSGIGCPGRSPGKTPGSGPIVGDYFIQHGQVSDSTPKSMAGSQPLSQVIWSTSPQALTERFRITSTEAELTITFPPAIYCFSNIRSLIIRS